MGKVILPTEGDPRAAKKRRSLIVLLLLSVRKPASAFTLAMSPQLARWFGTVPGILGSEAAEGAAAGFSGPGCALIGLIGIIVGALMLVTLALVNGSFHIGSSFSAENSSTKQPVDAQLQSAPATYGGSSQTSQSATTGSDSASPRTSVSNGLDEAALKAQRLKAIINGNTAEYNSLIQKHEALYAQYGVNPCIGGFFPEGCSAASSNREGKNDVNANDNPQNVSGAAQTPFPNADPPNNSGEDPKKYQNDELGKQIEWPQVGKDSTIDQTATKTAEMANNLTTDDVKAMIARGLKKEELDRVMATYNRKPKTNNLAPARGQLMDRIIELWPK